MSAPAIPTVLAPLVCYLDQLDGRIALDELTARLRESPVTLDDVRDYVHFDPHHYARNLVTEGPGYSLLVLCWRSGQRSPIHDHAESACVFKIVTGVCSETVYKFAPCRQVAPVHTRDVYVGEIVAVQQTDLHQVSNLQPPGQDLVTLHIYTPPLKSMHTFSIMGDGLTDWIGGGTGRPWKVKVSSPPAKPCLSDEQFEKVVHFMHANLKHDIHLDDFAKQTGHTPAHFSVLFKNRTDCSPFHYLKELRLRKAHQMIIAGETNLGKVALAVGYTNRSHFSEIFQASWKQSARELIAQVKAAAANHRR